ncbi:hypothetical protein IG631_17164 [Alternaria alternata]|nr:hypothetical protein IG631_17164 [Alternaria alternata]
MGRIYRESESVVVWLGQMSKLSEMSIAVFAGSTDRASMPPAECWNCREDQIISTGATAGIPAKYYHFAILGAATAPMTLQAREHFQQGRMWTLLEWMLACRGRSATDIRDLVFAGLSLVDPKGLLIDTDILLEESKSMTTKPVPVLTRNKYDPQTIPPFGVKAIDGSFYQRKPTSPIKSPSLIPNGL